jgi:hypothetical protein
LRLVQRCAVTGEEGGRGAGVDEMKVIPRRGLLP